jgi:hypothetical protein
MLCHVAKMPKFVPIRMPVPSVPIVACQAHRKCRISRPEEDFQVSSSLFSNSTVVRFLVWNEHYPLLFLELLGNATSAYLGMRILHIYLGMFIFHVYLVMFIIACLSCCQKCLVSVLPVPYSVLASALFSACQCLVQ